MLKTTIDNHEHGEQLTVTRRHRTTNNILCARRELRAFGSKMRKIAKCSYFNWFIAQKQIHYDC